MTPTHGFETMPPPEQWISALRDMILGAFAVIMSDEWRRLGNMVAVGVLWATNKPATVRSHLFLVASSECRRASILPHGKGWDACKWGVVAPMFEISNGAGCAASSYGTSSVFCTVPAWKAEVVNRPHEFNHVATLTG